MARSMQHRRQQPTERGSAALELVLVAPILFAFILLVVVLGRIQTTGAKVTGAARDAARAASQADTANEARAVAAATAPLALAGDSISCSTGVLVTTDTDNWRPGGSVSVTVACTTRVSGVGFVLLPGSHTMRSTVTVPLESLRSAT